MKVEANLKCILFFMLFLVGGSSFSQHPVDSLVFKHLRGAEFQMNRDLDAMFREVFLAEKLAKQKNDSLGKALVLKWKGTANLLSGEPEEAEACFMQSLELGKQLLDTQLVSAVSNNLGLLYQQKGKLKQALHYFKVSLSLDQQLQDLKGMAASYGNIGNVYQQLNFPYMALYNNALSAKLDYFEGNLDNVFSSLLNIGAILLSIDYHKPAIEIYQWVKAYSRSSGNQLLLSRVLNNLGFAYYKTEQWSASLAAYNECLPIRETRKDAYGLAITLSGLAEVYKRMGYWEKSNELIISALKIREEIEDARGISVSLWQIADNLISDEKYAEALPYLFQSTEGALETEDEVQVSDNYLSMAFCFLNLNELTKAQYYFQLSVQGQGAIGGFLARVILKMTNHEDETFDCIEPVSKEQFLSKYIILVLMALTLVFAYLYVEEKKKKSL